MTDTPSTDSSSSDGGTVVIVIFSGLVVLCGIAVAIYLFFCRKGRQGRKESIENQESVAKEEALEREELAEKKDVYLASAEKEEPFEGHEEKPAGSCLGEPEEGKGPVIPGNQV